MNLLTKINKNKIVCPFCFIFFNTPFKIGHFASKQNDQKYNVYLEPNKENLCKELRWFSDLVLIIISFYKSSPSARLLIQIGASQCNDRGLRQPSIK
jgi:hypothetical protein